MCLQTQIIQTFLADLFVPFELFIESETVYNTYTAGGCHCYAQIQTNCFRYNSWVCSAHSHHIWICSTPIKAINQQNTSSKLSLMAFQCGVFYVYLVVVYANTTRYSWYFWVKIEFILLLNPNCRLLCISDGWGSCELVFCIGIASWYSQYTVVENACSMNPEETQRWEKFSNGKQLPFNDCRTREMA